MPFPGIWSFEVTTDQGQTYKTHGSQSQEARITRLEPEEEQPQVEQTEAGAQYVAPAIPAREIPRGKLRPKVTQNDGPLPLELAETEAKQEKLL